MQEKIPDFVPGKYNPSKKRILAQSSGNIFFDHHTWAYAAVKLNHIQSNLNGSNIFGTVEIRSRHG